MTLQEFQRGLILLGYDLGPGGADGIPGRYTAGATAAFKERRGLSATPLIGPKTVEAMTNAIREREGLNPFPPAEKPFEAPPPVWMIEAARYLNVREVVGPGSNSQIINWAKRLGSKVVGIGYVDDDIPWCGLFVAHCIASALPGEPLPGIVVRASSWDTFGRSQEDPVCGTVLRFQRPGGGHVGFCAGRTADGRFYKVLGGNQSNRVSYAMIEASRLVSKRWPLTGGNPRELPIVTAQGVEVTRNEA